MHPGISHLYEFKKSRKWEKNISSSFFNYYEMSSDEKMRSNVPLKWYTEQSYVAAGWRSVNFGFKISFTTQIMKLGEYVQIFWGWVPKNRGNNSHIHGLIGIYEDEIGIFKDGQDKFTTKLKDYITKAQVCGIGNLVPVERLDKWKEKGILNTFEDWTFIRATGAQVLAHRCDNRRMRRINDTGDDSMDYICRKPHSVLEKQDPNKHEWTPLPFTFTPQCLQILYDCGLYEDPKLEDPNGTFNSHLLQPMRHMGVVQANDVTNMSPVIKEYFAATLSMKNAQVLSGTNGVFAYVVKYIVKFDQGNLITVWANSGTSSIIYGQEKFLHNTKITGSRLNEKKAFKKSRAHGKPNGQRTAFTEIQQQILGYAEVMKNLWFLCIQTTPLEQRSTTSIMLDKNGSVVWPGGSEIDSQSSKSPLEKTQYQKKLRKRIIHLTDS